LLHLLLGQARNHGFEFRRWFVEHIGVPWPGYNDALQWLATGRRAGVLLFSHGFARHFFQSGERIAFLVAPQTFERVTASGEIQTVHRKAHMRHSSREDVWLFHLREMAAAPEPLRYIRRYLITEESMSSITEEIASKQEEQEENYDDENLVRDIPPRRRNKPSS